MKPSPLPSLRCLAASLLVFSLGWGGAWASACEKHLEGHQNAAETQAELQSERR